MLQLNDKIISKNSTIPEIFMDELLSEILHGPSECHRIAQAPHRTLSTPESQLPYFLTPSEENRYPSLEMHMSFRSAREC
jgi:hypothetical protein